MKILRLGTRSWLHGADGNSWRYTRHHILTVTNSHRRWNWSWRRKSCCCGRHLWRERNTSQGWDLKTRGAWNGCTRHHCGDSPTQHYWHCRYILQSSHTGENNKQIATLIIENIDSRTSPYEKLSRSNLIRILEFKSRLNAATQIFH